MLKAILSIGKCLVKSRRVEPCLPKRERPLLILGNGPSLRATIDSQRERMASYDMMAVNFSANTAEFLDLKPRHYILADPHFFGAGDPNVERLWSNLARADWEMTLWLPARTVPPVGLPENIAVRHFNMTPVEGWRPLAHRLIEMGAGMPRPRNVLIPAIMAGMRAGYTRIHIAGADHSWLEGLRVDEDNCVISVQPHYYEEGKGEKERVREVYRNVRLHQILESMMIAFRSYWDVRAYAEKKGVEILNSTPGSYIDAFPRRPL